MRKIWSDENKLSGWLEVELLACEAMALRGDIPSEAAIDLRTNAKVNVLRMKEIEAEVKHDVVAFVSSVAEGTGENGRFLHLGLTLSLIHI